MEKRNVHSNYTRLRILNRKILVDFLQPTKAYINLELAKTPVMMTYKHALATFRNQVSRKFPPESSFSNSRRTRRINESGTCSAGRGSRFQGQVGRNQECGGIVISGERGRGRFCREN